ncbi:MAG: hypothetical protein NT170_04550 [Candidatus Moranbacteria bacterium]|nr:hypothetical protein [Candidatus Moranbacteria bacterium]
MLQEGHHAWPCGCQVNIKRGFPEEALICSKHKPADPKQKPNGCYVDGLWQQGILPDAHEYRESINETLVIERIDGKHLVNLTRFESAGKASEDPRALEIDAKVSAVIRKSREGGCPTFLVKWSGEGKCPTGLKLMGYEIAHLQHGAAYGYYEKDGQGWGEMIGTYDRLRDAYEGESVVIIYLNFLGTFCERAGIDLITKG